MEQDDDRGDLHLARLDLVSQELGGAAHHQTADEDGDDEEREVVHPTHADTAEPAVDLHVEHLHHTAQRRLRIVHRVHRAVRGDGRHHAPHGRSGRTDADLLALHRAAVLRDAHFVDIGVAAHLLRHGNQNTCREGEEHHAEDAAGQLAAADIESERPGHGHRDDEDRPALQHVGEGVGVLERMGGVRTEITAAVRTQLLDGHDGRRGALRNDLLLTFERRQGLLAVERHRRAVDDQQDTNEQRERHQDTGRALDEVNPEVADRLRGLRRQRLHDAGHSRHAAGRGDELEEHDDEDLREIRQTRLAAVMLQVTVHHERNAGIEGQIGRLARVAVGIHRQIALEHQQQHAPEEPEEVHHEQCLEELLPIHFLVLADAAHLVDSALEGSHEVEPRALPAIYFGNVASQRIAEHHQGDPLQNDT